MFKLIIILSSNLFFFSSRRRHTRLQGDWSSDVCSSDLGRIVRKRLLVFVDQPHGVRHALSQQVETAAAHVEQPVGIAHHVMNEIGRASCREKVMVRYGTDIEMIR